jgi:hypothetical protein
LGVGRQEVTAAPAVSVVLPVRDRRVLLRQALDALDAQTYRDFEVIVVDDGSTDGSAEEAQGDADAGRPVRVVRGKGEGAVRARMLGVEQSSATYLAFTDSDCVPDPGWLAAGVAALEDGADVVQGLTRPTRQPRAMERTVWSLHDDGLFATCNVFYRRAAYDAAGGFESAAGDRLGFRQGPFLQGMGFGEDTLLGWSVRRRGRATFAADSIVRHEVFGVDPAETLRRAWTTGAFPALFREVPELVPLMGPEFAKSRRDRLPLYVAAVALATGRRRLATFALGMWVATRAAAVAQQEPSWPRRIRVLPLDLAVEAVTATSLAVGSARARKVVL